MQGAGVWVGGEKYKVQNNGVGAGALGVLEPPNFLRRG